MEVDNTPEARGGFTFTGSIRGAVPEGAELAIVWVVVTGDDQAHSFGDAAFTSAGFSVALPPGEPPAAIVNDLRPDIPGRVAVGVPIALAAGTALPHGLIADANDLARNMVGASPRHAIIWRDGEFPADSKLSWPDAFPAGIYSCGRCAGNEGTFDQFELTGCGTVELQIASLDDLDMCNWN